MNYEINVCHQDKHLFATHERSIQSAGDLIRVFKTLDRKFPEQEGYKLYVSVSVVSHNGLDTLKFREYVIREKAMGLIFRLGNHIRKKSLARLMKGFKY